MLPKAMPLYITAQMTQYPHTASVLKDAFSLIWHEVLRKGGGYSGLVPCIQNK